MCQICSVNCYVITAVSHVSSFVTGTYNCCLCWASRCFPFHEKLEYPITCSWWFSSLRLQITLATILHILSSLSIIHIHNTCFSLTLHIWKFSKSLSVSFEKFMICHHSFTIILHLIPVVLKLLCHAPPICIMHRSHGPVLISFTKRFTHCVGYVYQ